MKWRFFLSTSGRGDGELQSCRWGRFTSDPADFSGAGQRIGIFRIMGFFLRNWDKHPQLCQTIFINKFTSLSVPLKSLDPWINTGPLILCCNSITKTIWKDTGNLPNFLLHTNGSLATAVGCWNSTTTVVLETHWGFRLLKRQILKVIFHKKTPLRKLSHPKPFPTLF